MTYPHTEIDKAGSELHDLAYAYATKAESLASDPYFREAVIRVSVSNFAWALYEAFDKPNERQALNVEISRQSDAICRSVVVQDRSSSELAGSSLESVDHVQLAIPSGGEVAARGFYGGLLGLVEQPKPPDMAKRGGCWFESANVKVHCGVEDPFRPARKAHVAFRVDGVRALAARARAAGFEVTDDRALPGHERVFIFDPFGNRLEFLRLVEEGA